jgi:phosphoribosylaminoimidazolecarboxamide formyltransferase / IMP cyclohydrolase
MPRALLSVYNKTGIVDFAKQLISFGYELVASGGTEKELKKAKLPILAVEKVTGAKEILGGRVKTLHPAIHGPILSRNTPEDQSELSALGYVPIEIVVCNLYPFHEVTAKKTTSVQDAIEYIDIGGVTLLRASAKNFLNVAVITDPQDYQRVIQNLRDNEGNVGLVLRRELAVKSFAVTRDYDNAIQSYLAQKLAPDLASDALPTQLSLSFVQTENVRYGENPHQTAAYYSKNATLGPLGGKLLSGKQLSYNNLLDLDSAWRAVSAFDEPTVVIVKHLNPTGIASNSSISAAFQDALASDPVSAFGGIIAVNQPVDDTFAYALGSLFIEAIAAPSFSPTACQRLSETRKNCRLVQIPHPYDGTELEMRSIHGGLLVQRPDTGDPEHTSLKVVSTRAPNASELASLQFAWKAVQHVKSNAIALAVGKSLIGIGGGLPSRVDSVRLAIAKADTRSVGSVLASDAFFPFADGVQLAIEAGVTAIIQPGGSIRDSEVIEVVNQANVAMIFTGTRHFRH